VGLRDWQQARAWRTASYGKPTMANWLWQTGLGQNVIFPKFARHTYIKIFSLKKLFYSTHHTITGVKSSSSKCLARLKKIFKFN